MRIPRRCSRDFPAALEWAQAHLKGANRVDQSVAMFGHAVALDFSIAAGTWEQLPPGVPKARAAGAILKNAPPASKEAAESVAQSLSEQDRKLAG